MTVQFELDVGINKTYHISQVEIVIANVAVKGFIALSFFEQWKAWLHLQGLILFQDKDTFLYNFPDYLR